MLRNRPINKVMSKGLSFACANCDNYWWGVDQGLGHCRAMEERRVCAGPMAGMAFPEYVGPLKGNLVRFCFVCGAQPIAAAVARGGGDRVGICKEHLDFLETFTRPGEPPPKVSHVHVPVVT